MTKLNTSMTKLNNQAIKEGKIMTNTTVKAREIELKTISWRRAAWFSGTSREQTTSQARYQVYYPRQVREDVDDI